MTTPAEQGIAAAKRSNRGCALEQLRDLRDAAMELAATLEFSNISGDVTENEIWQFATRTITHAEEIMANTRGELDEL